MADQPVRRDIVEDIVDLRRRMRTLEVRERPAGGAGAVVAAQAWIDGVNQTVDEAASGDIAFDRKEGDASITLVDGELIIPMAGWWIGHLQLAGDLLGGGQLDPDTFVRARLRSVSGGGEEHYANVSVPIVNPAGGGSTESFAGTATTPPFMVIADDVGGVDPARVGAELTLYNAAASWDVQVYGQDASALDDNGFPIGWDVTILSLRYLGAL